MPDPNFAPVFPELSGTENRLQARFTMMEKRLLGVSVITGLVDVRTLKLEILLWLFWMRELSLRTQKTTVERETENDVAQGLFGKIPIIKNNIGGVKVDGSTITSEARESQGKRLV